MQPKARRSPCMPRNYRSSAGQTEKESAALNSSNLHRQILQSRLTKASRKITSWPNFDSSHSLNSHRVAAATPAGLSAAPTHYANGTGALGFIAKSDFLWYPYSVIAMQG